jgi:cytochrome c oxidase subunit 2
MMHWFPENVSTYGGDVDGVFRMIWWIVGAWFVAAEGALLWFVVRYRRRPDRPATHVRGDRWGQLAWVLVPAAVVLALDLAIDTASTPVWARIKEQLPSDGIVVGGTAKQFNWAFAYPGPDGRLETADDVVLENELHVPAGENVRVRLGSQDVIHSFFIPAVRLKQDVLPGRTTEVWFNAVTPGTYELPCAELCGFGHYTMRGFLIVHAPDDYRAWAAKTLVPAGSGAEDPA